MIVASILLILAAVALLVAGLAEGSSPLLISSIAVSLLAAVALVTGTRQATAARATPDPAAEPGNRFRGGPAGSPYDARGGDPEIPVQHAPPAAGTGGPGWRQPAEPPVTDPSAPPPQAYGPREPYVPPGPRQPAADGARPVPDLAEPDTGPAADAPEPTSPAAEGPFDIDPPAQHLSAADVARLARLAAEVLVVDGHPRFHLDGCPELVGRDDEPLPVAEALGLGFTPCARCAPATTLLAEARPN